MLVYVDRCRIECQTSGRADTFKKDFDGTSKGGYCAGIVYVTLKVLVMGKDKFFQKAQEPLVCMLLAAIM